MFVFPPYGGLDAPLRSIHSYAAAGRTSDDLHTSTLVSSRKRRERDDRQRQRWQRSVPLQQPEGYLQADRSGRSHPGQREPADLPGLGISESTGAARRGAYGLRITGVADARALLVEARPDWPPLRLVCEQGEPLATDETVTDQHAELILKTGGRLTVDRRSGTARYAVPRQLSDDELIHPFLAPAAAVVAHWLGRMSLHAGAFVSNGAVWGLVGDREAGKSTTLAYLAMDGHEIVADDVLVLEGGSAYAGPRSIDLRRDCAEHLGVGTARGIVGARRRWRVPLPPIGDHLPFRGWIFLEWSSVLEAQRMSGSECLTRLMKNLTLRMRVADPGALLELASLPAWELRRPRGWPLMRETSECLLSVAR